jgi:hypothetical protein
MWQNPSRILTKITSQTVLRNKTIEQTGEHEIKTQPMKIKSGNETDVESQKKKKVILVGDSHARGCAEKLMNQLSDQYEITGYVKPGAN